MNETETGAGLAMDQFWCTDDGPANQNACLWILILGFSGIAIGCSPRHPLQIAYLQSDQYGIKTIWLVTDDGSKKEEAFTWLGNTNENFTWLPDGTALYVWALETPGRSGNYVLASLENGPGPCITCGISEYTGWPIPSPKGDKILVVSNTTSGARLYLADFDGANFHELEISRNVMTITREPTWSPDGKYIAFPAYAAGDGLDIYRIDLDGNNLLNLTSHHGPDDFFAPNWSPLGNKIALISSGNNTRIQIMSTDGSDLIDMTDWSFYGEVGYPSMAPPPQWSPDGEKLLFATKTDLGNYAVWVVNADGTGLTNLSDQPLGDDLDPAWSPDGMEIVFETNRDGNWEVYVMNADGTNQLNLSRSPGTSDLSPAWRP